DGTVSGVFVHGVDVTEKVQARHDVESARADAEAANRVKGEFLATMSHELRTPLNAIAGYAQLLELGVHGPITEPQREALRRIQRSEQHLLSLVNDVLNFAKLEAGRIDYDLKEMPLIDVIATISPMVEPQLTGKGLQYEVRVTDDLRVRADREKLQQILLNLMSNAIKFTESGGTVSIDIGRRSDDPSPEGVVFVRVSDTGVGIPRDKQDAIFDAFVQVSRHLTTSSTGTGLGLSISRDLARGMGGELRVRSELGKGSTFTLVLPAA
ncbi:MAG: HAMP domain-containing sensor histidine kinase, partial [Gemmatimonadaceae bacterium]